MTQDDQAIQLPFLALHFSQVKTNILMSLTIQLLFGTLMLKTKSFLLFQITHMNVKKAKFKPDATFQEVVV